MKVFGVSQSSGVERNLHIERGHEGVVLIIRDPDEDKELERTMVAVDDLLSTITDPAPGGRTVEGIAPGLGSKVLLDVEVRRNEVWITARSASGHQADVAVGLDDLQDALEGTISRD
jgi:hypothetical protein